MPTLALSDKAGADERSEAQHRTVSAARIDKNRILDGVDGFIVKIVS
ncbi:hypothetical protein [Streptomyces deccanensis]|nr:hypothetical protein [Streptomyces deccanensis]ULR55731.1 hypothetical protein L3078_44185 [Streptomyces deccanensis]